MWEKDGGLRQWGHEGKSETKRALHSFEHPESRGPRLIQCGGLQAQRKDASSKVLALDPKMSNLLTYHPVRESFVAHPQSHLVAMEMIVRISWTNTLGTHFSPKQGRGSYRCCLFGCVVGDIISCSEKMFIYLFRIVNVRVRIPSRDGEGCARNLGGNFTSSFKKWNWCYDVGYLWGFLFVCLLWKRESISTMKI